MILMLKVRMMMIMSRSWWVLWYGHFPYRLFWGEGDEVEEWRHRCAVPHRYRYFTTQVQWTPNIDYQLPTQHGYEKFVSSNIFWWEPTIVRCIFFQMLSWLKFILEILFTHHTSQTYSMQFPMSKSYFKQWIVNCVGVSLKPNFSCFHQRIFEFWNFFKIFVLGWLFCSVCVITHGTDKKNWSPAL